AATFARRALAAVELTENELNAARAHHLLAYVELERGNPAEALELLRKGMTLVERSGERFELTLFRLDEARALVKLGRIREAKEIALDVATTLDGVSRVDAARAFGVLADVFAEAGEPDRAIDLYRESLEQMAASPL